VLDARYPGVFVAGAPRPRANGSIQALFAARNPLRFLENRILQKKKI
jgi:hypothetical protein